MFDRKTLVATPANARRILEFKRLNGMQVDETIIYLAEQDRVDTTILAGTPLELDDVELKVLQRVMDWNGRGLILGDGYDESRKIALANVKLRPPGQTLVLAKAAHFGAWATLVKDNWPGATISVCGNPRHFKQPNSLPDGVVFSDTPDTKADFIITGFSTIGWHDLLAKCDPAQSIIEELDHPSVVTYKWTDLVNGMFVELGSPLILQNLNNLPTHPGLDIITSIQTLNSKALCHISDLVSDYLWCGSPLPAQLLSNGSRGCFDYLVERGYSGLDIWRLLPVFGASVELITSRPIEPMDFIDESILEARKSPARKSGLTRIVTRETELEDRTGQKMSQIASKSASGDADAAALIEGLRGGLWANAKARSVRHVIERIASRTSKILVLAEQPDLVRNLRLVLSSGNFDNLHVNSEDLSSATDHDSVMARFLFPDPAYRKHSRKLTTEIRPLQVMVIKPTDLDHSDLLRVADFVIMAEWPTDRATYQVIREDYIEAKGARLIHTTLAGTVEEYLKEELT